MANKTAKKGDTVRVDYTGKLETGEVFDSSKGKEPLEFELGSGKVIPGFDDGIIGMKEDQEKDITISPEKGYGNRSDNYIKEIPKNSVPEKIKLEKGMILLFKRQDGMTMPCTVNEIGKDTIKVDFNHPLAGKTLKFNVKLIHIK